MTCEQTRQKLLELGWTADQRRDAIETLRHLEHCADCQTAVAQYEKLHEQLRAPVEIDAPVGGWEQFERRLLLAADAPRRSSWITQALKLAAAFLLGIVLIEALRWKPANQVAVAPPATSPTNGQIVANPSTPPFTPQEVADHAQAFDQVSQVFDRRTSWVLLANNTSDVGLVEEPVTQHHRLLLLRLTMLKAGQSISSSDLMILPGQNAKLTVPLQNGQSVHYEISTSNTDPTRLSLWAELQNHGATGQAIGALATTLQLQPDQKVSAGELTTSSGAYQLKVGFSQAAYGGGKS